MITQEYLHYWFKYEEGKLLWIMPKKGIQEGTALGWKDKKRGYYCAELENKGYLLHRLIYLYHTGKLPEYLDHIDCDKSNNRIENLRECTKAQNAQNTAILARNSTGIKGLSYNNTTKCWQACVTKNGVRYQKVLAGSLDSTAIVAILAEWLKDKRQQLHLEFTNHG